MKRWLIGMVVVALLAWPLGVVFARGGGGRGPKGCPWPGGSQMGAGMSGGAGTGQQERLRLRDGSCLQGGQPARTQSQTQSQTQDQTRTQERDRPQGGTQ